MSTGDQSQYIRGKIAERGSQRGAHFMTDGFDRWAESSTPARAGQMEKIPAETQMENYGGAMTLSKAKRLQAMMGGKSITVAGIPIEVPQYIEDGINVAKKMSVVVDWTVQKLPGFIEDLTDNVIDKPGDYAPEIIADAKQLLGILQGLRGWVDGVKYILDIAKSLGGAFGMGRRGGKRLVGGDWTSTFESAKKTVESLIEWYNWLKQKAAFLRAILALESVKEAGGDQLLAKLDPILSAIGMGRRGSKKCCCDDEYEGGAQMVNYIAPPMRKAPPMMGGPVSRGGMQMVNYSPPMRKGPPMMSGQNMARGGAQAYIGTDYNPPPMMSGQNMASGPISKGSPSGLFKPPSMSGPISGRVVGGASGNLTKLKSLLRNPPRIPGVPKRGGMSALEKVEYMSPEDKKYMMAAERRKSQSVGMGGASCGGRKPSARGEIVKKVMREQGLSLPQASKYVKEQGLY